MFVLSLQKNFWVIPRDSLPSLKDPDFKETFGWLWQLGNFFCTQDASVNWDPLLKIPGRPMTVNHQSPNGQQSNATWPFPHGQPILLQYMISFQFGLTQLPLSDSQELYLDLPGPKERPADSDDDDDDEDVEEDEEEGKDERAEMLRVPIPSPSSVPVFGGNQEKWSTWTGCSGKWCCHHFRTGGQQRGRDRNLSARVHFAEAQKSKSPVEVAPSTPHACHHERDTDFKGWRNQDPCGRTQQITGSIEVSCL